MVMSERLSREGIETHLTTRFVGRYMEVYEEIDSTNARAVTLARQGAPDGTLVLAERQTEGRGRLGRRWFAPLGSSLLMSLILRPHLVPRQAQRMTMICSLAAIEAISEVTGLDAQVKWPNDILLSGKKLGGVLTELGLCGEQLDYTVVGMGLNVDLDLSALPDLMAPATSLLAEIGRPVARRDILVTFLQHVETHYDALATGWSPHIAWRAHLATLGEHVRVGTPEEIIVGLAEDVDADGALLVRTDEGQLRTIVAGDVTLRGHLLG